MVRESLKRSGMGNVRPSFRGSVRDRGESSSGPTNQSPISNDSDSTDNEVEE